MHIASPTKGRKTAECFRESLGWIKPCGWPLENCLQLSHDLVTAPFDFRAWGLPCVFILNCSKITLNAVPRWFEMNADVVCEVSVPLLCCAQQVLPVVQLRGLRVTDLPWENSSVVPAHLHLNLFLALWILGVQSWSSVLIGLLVCFRSFHVTVEFAGNPASIVRGKKCWSVCGDCLIWDKYRDVGLES